jgi:hypothetical protein
VAGISAFDIIDAIFADGVAAFIFGIEVYVVADVESVAGVIIAIVAVITVVVAVI